MTALNKQALIAKIRKQTESFDTVVLKEGEVNTLLDELETVQKTSAARLEAIDRTHKMFQRERDRADAAEKRIAEHRKVLNSLAAVARRYLPDYDEHPEIQAADELLESTAGIGVKGE